MNIMIGKGDNRRPMDRQRTTKAWFDTEYDRIFYEGRRLEQADEVVAATADETLEEIENVKAK
ncbi:hypothetical protein LCGC14_1438320 [marine sediment metagenome]|uniref:Uncharacterized protein n=1 Tax=marine sediment metagenome TaxID=412755 RepID=A0A0F9JLF7_9ZZZZ